MERMADTPLQKSLDLLSHEPGQHFSPLGALQQSFDYPGPASQHDFDYSFGQTSQQDGIGNGFNANPLDFLTLPMQPEEALEEDRHRIPFRSFFR